MRLLEAARPEHALDRAARRVEIRRHSQSVGDRVAETGGRLRVPEDHRPARQRLPEEFTHPQAEFEARPVDHGRPLRHMLAQHIGDEQMGPLGIAAQSEAQQLPELPVASGRPVADELDAQSLRHPATRPHHVRRLFPCCALAHRDALIPRGPRPADPRTRRLPSPRRRPRPAAACARPRPGGASLRSSCSYTRSASLHRLPAPAA